MAGDSGLKSCQTNSGKLRNVEATHTGAVKIDLNRPMKEILANLSQYPVSTFLLLNGTI